MSSTPKSWGRQRAFRRPDQPYDFKGLQAHVTVRLSDSYPVLDREKISSFLTTILTASEDPRWEALAICVMPDHFHLLLQSLEEGLDLSEIVKFIKRSHARRSGLSKMWQGSFHDRLIRDHESVESHARYIVENPVSAGFCDNYAEWPGTYLADGVL